MRGYHARPHTDLVSLVVYEALWNGLLVIETDSGIEGTTESSRESSISKIMTHENEGESYKLDPHIAVEDRHQLYIERRHIGIIKY